MQDICSEKPLIISSVDGFTPAQRSQATRPRQIKPATAALLSKLFSESSIDESVQCPVQAPMSSKSNTEITTAKSKSPAARPKKSVGSKKNKTDNVCHPAGLKPTKQEGKSRKSAKMTPKTPYSKSNYMLWSSSDDDFQ
jgi:hypothetical protein